MGVKILGRTKTVDGENPLSQKEKELMQNIEMLAKKLKSAKSREEYQRLSRTLSTFSSKLHKLLSK